MVTKPGQPKCPPKPPALSKTCRGGNSLSILRLVTGCVAAPWGERLAGFPGGFRSVAMPGRAEERHTPAFRSGPGRDAVPPRSEVRCVQDGRTLRRRHRWQIGRVEIRQQRYAAPVPLWVSLTELAPRRLPGRRLAEKGVPVGTKTITMYVSDLDQSEIPAGQAYQLSIRHPDGSTQQLDISEKNYRDLKLAGVGKTLKKRGRKPASTTTAASAPRKRRPRQNRQTPATA